MGSTYLQLTNKVLRRLNEVELTEASFASARGVHAVAKDAVIDTIRNINTQKFEWPFNKMSGSQVLTIDKPDYTWPADLKIVDWDSFYVSNDGVLATKTTTITQISKEDYWRYFRNDDLDADGTNVPKCISETSGGGFVISPKPDKAYTILYTYFINTIDMVTYDDTTTIPDLYDHVVVDGALWFMYSFLDNVVRADIHKSAFKKGLDDMALILIPKSPSITDTRINYGGGNYSSGFYWDNGGF